MIGSTAPFNRGGGHGFEGRPGDMRVLLPYEGRRDVSDRIDPVMTCQTRISFATRAGMVANFESPDGYAVIPVVNGRPIID